MLKIIDYRVFFLLLSCSVQAGTLYNLGLNFAKGLINPQYVPEDILNRSAEEFRVGVKALYGANSFFGGSGYDNLQREYLFPPDGAVPLDVRMRLTAYSNASLSSVEPNVSIGTLRRDNYLGKQESEFVANRLQNALPLFCEGEKNKFFITPDTSLKNNPSPYGYALDRGLNQAFQTVESAPRIAVCFSGGGFRAMIATLGFLEAASDIGIADSFLYSANLSGSTWCSIPWSLGASLKELKQTYEKYARVRVSAQTISDIRDKVPLNVELLKKKYTTTFLWEQPLSLVNGVWGPLIAQMTISFWDDPELRQKSGTKRPYQSAQYMYFWQALDYIKNGKNRPFPLASETAKKQKSENGIWMEFNPEYVGFEYLTERNELVGIWLPSIALGRTFTEIAKEPSRWYRFLALNTKIMGYESKSGPVQTLDYWMGVWGSAFTVSPLDLYRIVFKQNNITISEADISRLKTDGYIKQTTDGMNANDKGSSIASGLFNMLGESLQYVSQVASGTATSFAGVRLYPARFNNFAKFPDSPFAKAKTITAVDAGIDFNLPLPPLLRSARALDLIIVGDWSEMSPQTPAKELVLAEKWARNRDVSFPLIQKSVHYTTVYNKPMTLFNEYPEGQTGPAILYIPLMDNQFNADGFSVAQCFKGACSTFNFNYFSNDQNYVQKLSNHIYRTVWGVYPQLRQVVQGLVDAKNQQVAFSMTALNSSLL